MVDCLAMTEPGVARCARKKCFTGMAMISSSMAPSIFISHADEATFNILPQRARIRQEKLITAFLVDKGTKGFTVLGMVTRTFRHRGYNNCILESIAASTVADPGELHKGFDVANEWPAPQGCK
jgi:alkylation response protein AidB-like acyl-CoA dehydrogenase